MGFQLVFLKDMALLRDSEVFIVTDCCFYTFKTFKVF